MIQYKLAVPEQVDSTFVLEAALCVILSRLGNLVHGVNLSLRVPPSFRCRSRMSKIIAGDGEPLLSLDDIMYMSTLISEKLDNLNIVYLP